MRKRSMTLIELVIALTLFSILMTSLFTWYSHLTRQHILWKQQQRPLLCHHYAYQRLDRLLSHLITATSHDHLCFTFDNGIDSNPELSGITHGELFCESGQLLVTLRSTRSTAEHTLVILDGIDTCSFQFLVPQLPSCLITPTQVGDTRPAPGWHDSWNSPERPAMIRLHLNDQITWTFDLLEPILYPARST